MNQGAIFTIGIITIVCVLFGSCSKESISTQDDFKFCVLVHENNFDQTGPIINDFLDGLKKDKPDENLEKLANWLESISCVNKVSILCNSCIYTDPPMSELKVDYHTNGLIVATILDIKMSEPLKFVRYH
jgi:hypothetical protein